MRETKIETETKFMDLPKDCVAHITRCVGKKRLYQFAVRFVSKQIYGFEHIGTFVRNHIHREKDAKEDDCVDGESRYN